MKRVLIAATAGLVVAGCAKPADEITSAYVSPLTYEQYNCEQLAAEASRVSSRAAEVIGVQDEKAKRDALAMGVGLVLFWPALLAVKGSGETESEVSRLKGEMDAIEQVAIQKQCGFEFQRPEPVAPQAPDITDGNRKVT